MVDSPIDILPIYLDCSGERIALAGGVSSLEDDTEMHESESRIIYTYEQSDRVFQSWQLTLKDHESEDARFIWELYQVCRTSKGFLFISPKEEERVFTRQILRNTVTDGLVGDGSTKTFQLQRAISLSHFDGVSSSSTAFTEVNYPLEDTVQLYSGASPATYDDVDLETGIVTYTTAPGVGVVPYADFECAIPVIFTSKVFARTLLEAANSEARSVQFKEIP